MARLGLTPLIEADRRYTRRIMFALRLVLVWAIAASQAVSSAPQAQSQAVPEAISKPAKLSPSAISELQAKAEGGDAPAQLALGVAYGDGNGVPQSDELAAKWYRKAAEQGNATAQNNLGIMYRTGRGVEKSKEEAVRWYRKGTKQKNANAMFNLAASYYNGDGVPTDYVAAYAWFLLAQEAGSDSAADAVKRTSAEMKPFEAAESERRIAEMYAAGVELPQNYTESAKWYRRGAEHHDAESQVLLAAMLITGNGVPQDYAEAKRWCEIATKTGHAGGPYCVGYLYQRGLGVKQDSGEAIKKRSNGTGKPRSRITIAP